jgi:peptide/nickel transport system ATP-binding protein
MAEVPRSEGRGSRSDGPDPRSDGRGPSPGGPDSRTEGPGLSPEGRGPKTGAQEARSRGPRTSDLASRLLTVDHLTTVFDLPGGTAPAVADVSFHVSAGETLCLVGESGSGKSVTALSILRLVDPPGRIASGDVRFNGRSLMSLEEREMQRVRGAGISLIFQEPMTALNPVFTIGNQIEEMLQVHGVARGRAARARAIELLAAVSIPEPDRRVTDYPHQLSGGLRQRALIAMALACNPPLVIADEPTTALDVTIQAQILDLLRDLQKRFGLALLLITHDLGVVAEMADRVAVMYAGRIVEEAPVRELFRNPKHPYTRGLLMSIPGGRPGSRLQAIQGTVPPLGQLPSGCSFAPRCPDRFEPCAKAVPGVTRIADLPPKAGSHEVAGGGGSHGAAGGDGSVGVASGGPGPQLESRGFRLQAEGSHTTRCYLYSRAVDPEIRAEEPR